MSRNSILMSDDQSFSIQPDFGATHDADNPAGEFSGPSDIRLLSDDESFSVQAEFDRMEDNDDRPMRLSKHMPIVRWKLEYHA